MKNLKEIINLQSMTFENLLGLYQLVVAEISRRADKSAKEKWKDAKTFKIGDIQINKECE